MIELRKCNNEDVDDDDDDDDDNDDDYDVDDDDDDDVYDDDDDDDAYLARGDRSRLEEGVDDPKGPNSVLPTLTRCLSPVAGTAAALQAKKVCCWGEDCWLPAALGRRSSRWSVEVTIASWTLGGSRRWWEGGPVTFLPGYPEERKIYIRMKTSRIRV